MSRGTGGDLDETLILEGAKCREHVLVEAIPETRQRPCVPVVIEAGERRHLLVAVRLKAADIGGRPRCPLRCIVNEMLDDEGIAQLLCENRRNADRQTIGNALISEIVKRLKKGDIRFRHRLMDPFLAMWPHPRLPGIGKMAVQHESECSSR